MSHQKTKGSEKPKVSSLQEKPSNRGPLGDVVFLTFILQCICHMLNSIFFKEQIIIG